MTSCQHVEEYKKKKNFLKNLRRIHENFIIHKRNFKNPLPIKCFDCNKCVNRLHICLSCVYIGCYDGKKHIHQHISLTSHFLAMDTEYGVIYCSKCSDYIYDQLNEQYILKAYLKFGFSIDSLKLFHPWIPIPQEYYMLEKYTAMNHNNFHNGIDEHNNTLNKRRRHSSDKSSTLNISHAINPLGLKGLINLGNTCFMNCILQALIHVPVLKSYFLNDMHICKMENAAQCLLCELGCIYQDFYTITTDYTNKCPDDSETNLTNTSGTTTDLNGNSCGGTTNNASSTLFAHAPSNFLHLVWSNAKHLSGYEQQDAHEFFIAALDVLHKHAQGISAQNMALATSDTVVVDETKIKPNFYNGGGGKLMEDTNSFVSNNVGSLTNQDRDECVANLTSLSGVINNKISNCDCVIDQIFTGLLQSDVTCQNCKSVSTTIDPFWDISLDLHGNRDDGFSHHSTRRSESKLQLQPSNSNLQQLQQQHSYHGNTILSPSTGGASLGGGSSVKGGGINTRSHGALVNSSHSSPASAEPLSLEKCLDRFTCRENLGSQSKIKCSTCGIYQESTKQLTMRKLPIVACFHLKRFEHQQHNNGTGSSGSSRHNSRPAKNRKITQYVSFPEELDMTPYLATCKVPNPQPLQIQSFPILPSCKKHTTPARAPFSGVADTAANKYVLFAVVNHVGNLNSGHYACYVKNHPVSNILQILPSSLPTNTGGATIPYGQDKIEPLTAMFEPQKQHLSSSFNTSNGSFSGIVNNQNSILSSKGQWFRCNDHNITPADINDVLRSEGYLLFYQKRYLHYDTEES